MAPIATEAAAAGASVRAMRIPLLVAPAALVLGALSAASPAQAVDRPPMTSCGDTETVAGVLIGDVTERSVTCRTA